MSGGRDPNSLVSAHVVWSDLRRSRGWAELALGTRDVEVMRDPRIRGCDDGGPTRRSVAEIAREKPRRLREPSPHRESNEQGIVRLKTFKDDLPASQAGRRVLVGGHRPTLRRLEAWPAGVSLSQAAGAPWSGRPGWSYTMDIMPTTSTERMGQP